MENDKRRDLRTKSFLGGRIVRDDGLCVSCVIRNVSRAGAMLELPSATALPEEWCLIDMKNAKAHRVSITWRKDQRLGVRFQRSVDLTRNVPEEMTHLQRIWAVERQVRGDTDIRP